MAHRENDLRWYDRLLAVDRRWIYAILAIAVLIPAIFPFQIAVVPSAEVEAIYAYVESLEPGDNLLIAIDFDPSTLAELQPMTEALLYQAFENDVNVVITTLSQFGPAMAEDILEVVATRAGAVMYQDYTFLGYKPYPALVILAMGTDFRLPFPVDYYGVAVDSIPMMQDIHNYQDVKAVISMAAGNVADFWITYGNAKYGVPVALGVTGVMASDYYPYLQSNQIFGLIPGVKGAAEYEMLVGRPGFGMRGMSYQMMAHLVVLAFMVITNVAYLAQRRERRRSGMMVR